MAHPGPQPTADLAGADHDYAPLQVDSSGALYTRSMVTELLITAGNSTLVTIDELNNLDGSNTSGTVTFEDTSPKAKQQKKDNKTKSGYFPDSKTLKGTN